MKDFEKWHNLKCEIDANSYLPIFNEREIWWCSVGVNVGSEEDGKHERFERPVIIFEKFNERTFWGIQLTSRGPRGPYDIPMAFAGRNGSALVSQMKTFSAKRLIRPMGKLRKRKFARLIKFVSGIIAKKAETPPNGGAPHCASSSS